MGGVTGTFGLKSKSREQMLCASCLRRCILEVETENKKKYFFLLPVNEQGSSLFRSSSNFSDFKVEDGRRKSHMTQTL